jgi:anti-sigma factor RsiW
MTAPIGEDDLMAWVDGRLPPERGLLIDTYLAENPDLASRLRLQKEQRLALSAAFLAVTSAPIPSAMRVDTIAARRRAGPQWWHAAAAALLLAVGFGGGWGLRTTTLPPQAGIGALAQEATYNYRVYASDFQRSAEIGPDDRRQLISWASRRIGSRVAIPDLASAGYRFAGGRLVATPHGPAVMFLYEGPSSTRLAVLSRPMEIDKAAKMTPTMEGNINRITWADRGIGYSVVAPRSPAELQPLADTIQRQALTA